MVENRKFIRLKSPLPVEYSLIKKHKRQKKYISIMRNVSVGGLSLLLKEEVRIGDLIQVDIRVPHWVSPVRVVGDVIWHSPSREREKTAPAAGVRFREVNPAELNKILDYVYSVAIG